VTILIVPRFSVPANFSSIAWAALMIGFRKTWLSSPMLHDEPLRELALTLEAIAFQREGDLLG
jgi:hypothetical protein